MPVQRASRNRLVPLLLGGLVVAMVGLAYASVPLYRLFCQVTGYGGTTAQAERAPDIVSDATVTVRFNADVNRDLPWAFEPVQRAVTVRLGETVLAWYRATNLSQMRVTGTATFNVTPMPTGPYFKKIQCFCFEKQTLEPGQSVDMAVSFFVDPAMLEGKDVRDVREITLSYTFFRAADELTPDVSQVSHATGGAAGASLE